MDILAKIVLITPCMCFVFRISEKSYTWKLVSTSLSLLKTQKSNITPDILAMKVSDILEAYVGVLEALSEIYDGVFFEDRRRFFFHKATMFTISFITDVFKDPKYCILLCFKFCICDKFCDGIWSKNWKPEKEPSRFLSNSDNGFEQSTSNLVWICPMNVNLDYQGIAVPAVTFFELFNKNNFSLHINTDKLTLYRIIKITLHNLKGRRQSI